MSVSVYVHCICYGGRCMLGMSMFVYGMYVYIKG